MGRVHAGKINAMTTAYVETGDGPRLAYQTAGGGDPPLMFVHGWSGDRSSFAPQYAHFAGRHAVAALDLRGHGGSDRPEPARGVYDVESFAADTLAVASAAGLDRPVFVGHSLGALVALECAATAGAARAAVLVDPAPVLSASGKAYFDEGADAVEDDRDGSWRAAFVTGLLLPTDTVRREELIMTAYALPPPVAAAALRAIARYDAAAALARLAVPVLVIGAGGIESGLRRDERLAKGQTVGAGHFPHLEVPDQVNAMIERFLALNGLG
jgi:pimeloyl-ACP methyl ester carboxylesterase